MASRIAGHALRRTHLLCASAAAIAATGAGTFVLRPPALCETSSPASQAACRRPTSSRRFVVPASDDGGHSPSSVLEPPDSDLEWMFRPDQTGSIALHQVNANSEIEDRAVVQPIHTITGATFTLAAVIDGHGGWQVGRDSMSCAIDPV